MSEPHDHKSLKKPDIISSFEFRGETIHVEWFDISDISELPGLSWQQVYAVGNVGGQVLVVHFPEGNNSDNLPGGQIEKDESIEEALKRELQEEANMRVLSWRPIGYQKLSNPVHGIVYQLRVYAELEPIGKFVSDPGGSVIGHSFVLIDDLNSYIKYGEVGDRIIGLVKKYFA
jgi:8-oxo-dGTP pyrophosphatase MutT (NUDIX family)